MRTLTELDLPEWLREKRPHPLDDEYNHPHSGGCWICHKGNGFEDSPEEFAFDTEYDAFYHTECLEDSPYESLHEMENELRHTPNNDTDFIEVNPGDFDDR